MCCLYKAFFFCCHSSTISELFFSIKVLSLVCKALWATKERERKTRLRQIIVPFCCQRMISFTLRGADQRSKPYDARRLGTVQLSENLEKKPRTRVRLREHEKSLVLGGKHGWKEILSTDSKRL